MLLYPGFQCSPHADNVPQTTLSWETYLQETYIQVSYLQVSLRRRMGTPGASRAEGRKLISKKPMLQVFLHPLIKKLEASRVLKNLNPRNML